MSDRPMPGETLQLVGGFSDGQIVTIRPGEPIPHRWNVVIPVPITVYYADDADLMRATEIDCDEYVPAIDETGRPSRNDRGELVYRLAGGWRDGNWKEASR